MKIIHKLIYGFILVISLIVVVGYFAVRESRKALQISITETSEDLAVEIMDKIDRDMYSKIEVFKDFSRDLILLETIKRSNREFEKLDNIETYIEEEDKKWTSSPNDTITPFMEKLINSKLSKALREKIGFYEERYNYKVFGEVFVTNKYGANVAQSGKTSDYKQDDEGWWQGAKKNGQSVSDVAYDESADVYSAAVGIRVDDKEGKFLGVIKVVLNIEEAIKVIRELEHHEPYAGHKTRHFKLATKDGKLLYSSMDFNLFDDVTQLVSDFENPVGEHINHLKTNGYEPHEGGELSIHVHSKGYRDFEGLGWILIVNYETDDIFEPVTKLRNRILIVAIVLCIIAMLIAFIISSSIAKPIKKLRDATIKIGEGKFDTSINIKSSDEVGYLATSFNKMTQDLQKTTVSRDLLIKEMDERRQAEEAIHKSEERFRDIAENSSDWIWEVDSRAKYTYSSPVVEKILGYNPDEVVGKYFFDFVHNDEREKTMETIYEVFSQKKAFKKVTNKKQHKDGRTIFCESSGIPILDDEGLLGYRGSVRDITERIQAEEEREKIQAQLLQSQKMEAIGVLAGGIAHDFNNLLTTIQGYTDLVMMKLDMADPLYRNIKQINHASLRAADLTRQLLLFSRKQPMEHTPFIFNKTIINLLKMIDRLIGEDIFIETYFEPEIWTLIGDEGSVEQVIMNIAVNSRDAMPEGGKLTIKTENVTLGKKHCNKNADARYGTFIKTSISDTGLGMNKETMEHIFEPFYTTKGVGKGTGLGLAVAHGIVKQHEGWMNVFSEPGHGTTFEVYLPAYPKKLVEKAEETVSLEEFQGSGERILLVEDEKEVREFTAEVLSNNGYFVSIAADTKDAINIFERERGYFHLILSDVVLPDESGIKLVEKLLYNRPDLRILFCSGYIGDKSQISVIKEKGFPFLQKPYKVAKLLKAVKKAVSLKRKVES